MVNINKKYLEEGLKKTIWTGFLKGITRVKSNKELEQFLGRLFTPSERVMIEKRLAIFYLIEQGYKYREIGEMIDVAPSTISFVKKGFKMVNPKNKKTNPKLQSVNLSKNYRAKYPKYPTFTGKGRWRFLNM